MSLAQPEKKMHPGLFPEDLWPSSGPPHCLTWRHASSCGDPKKRHVATFWLCFGLRSAFHNAHRRRAKACPWCFSEGLSNHDACRRQCWARHCELVHTNIYKLYNSNPNLLYLTFWKGSNIVFCNTRCAKYIQLPSKNNHRPCDTTLQW